jgi:hypothetical protein
VSDVEESPLLDAPMPRVEIPLPPSFADDAVEVPSPEDVSGNGSPSTGTEGE